MCLSIIHFPVELLQSITQYLNPKDLLSCCHVSQDWYAVFNNDLLWEKHIEKYKFTTHFPNEVETMSKQLPSCHYRLQYLCYCRRKRHWMKNLCESKYMEKEVLLTAEQKYDTRIKHFECNGKYLIIGFNLIIQIWSVEKEFQLLRLYNTPHMINKMKFHRSKIIVCYKNCLSVYDLKNEDLTKVKSKRVLSIQRELSNIQITKPDSHQVSLPSFCVNNNFVAFCPGREYIEILNMDDAKTFGRYYLENRPFMFKIRGFQIIGTSVAVVLQTGVTLKQLELKYWDINCAGLKDSKVLANNDLQSCHFFSKKSSSVEQIFLYTTSSTFFQTSAVYLVDFSSRCDKNLFSDAMLIEDISYSAYNGLIYIYNKSRADLNKHKITCIDLDGIVKCDFEFDGYDKYVEEDCIGASGTNWIANYPNICLYSIRIETNNNFLIVHFHDEIRIFCTEDEGINYLYSMKLGSAPYKIGFLDENKLILYEKSTPEIKFFVYE